MPQLCVMMLTKVLGERILKSVVKPSYIIGTKQRVFYDINNKAKNHILPVIGITLKSISYEKERQASKNQVITVSTNDLDTSYDRPMPIKISVDIIIIAKYMTDLYQIYGKIITQFNPYVTYSWFVPQNIKYNYIELRNKIECTGNLNIDVRTEAKDESDRFTGTMSFEIDAWMFPTMNSCIENIIYDIGTTVIPSEDVRDRIYNEISANRPLVHTFYNSENEKRYNNPREFATAHPQITSVYLTTNNYNTGNSFFIMDKSRANTIKVGKGSKLLLNGYNFSKAKVMAIIKSQNIKGAQFYNQTYTNELHPYPNSKEEKPKEISGYLLNISKQTDNQIEINFDNLEAFSGSFDLAVLNDIGYDSLENRKGFKLTAAI